MSYFQLHHSCPSCRSGATDAQVGQRARTKELAILGKKKLSFLFLVVLRIQTLSALTPSGRGKKCEKHIPSREIMTPQRGSSRIGQYFSCKPEEKFEILVARISHPKKQQQSVELVGQPVRKTIISHHTYHTTTKTTTINQRRRPP